MQYGQSKKSTGNLRWIASNKQESIERLDKWIDVLLSDPAERRTFADVLAGYTTDYIDTLGDTPYRLTMQAFDAYFPPDSPQVDALRFRYDDLRDYLTARHDELALKYKRGTLGDYRTSVSRLFTAYAIPKGYIDRNPMAVTAKSAGKPSKSEVHVWTAAEVTLIAHHASDPALALWYRWQFLTGMRPSESVRMRWEDFTDGGLTIYGAAKGATKTADIVRDGERLRPRAFVLRESRDTDAPLIARWMDEMREVIDSVRAMTGDEVHVWPEVVRCERFPRVQHRTDQRARDFFRAVTAAGIERGERRLYDLRASAGDHMESLGMEDQLIADISGHDRSMRMKKYRPARDVERLDRKISGR